MSNDHSGEPAADPRDAAEKSPSRGGSILQTAVLLACSAAFGGLTVAFWNRKALNRMHSQLEEERENRAEREAVILESDDDIY